jgi:hypothetical protein
VIVVDVRFPVDAPDESEPTGAVPLVVDSDATADLEVTAPTTEDTDEMDRPSGDHPLPPSDAAAWEETNSSVTPGTDPREE